MLTLGRLKDDYSVLSPLTGLGGRNGGLGLKSRWRALWAIGVKVVSLKSTFWGFWWIWVVGSGGWVFERVNGSGRVLPYICGGLWSGVLDYIWRAVVTCGVSGALGGALWGLFR